MRSFRAQRRSRARGALVAVLVVTLVAAETARAAQERRIAPKLFVHGLKGGRLVSADGELRWVGRRQVLGFGPSIALPLRFEGDRQASDGVWADRVLDSVRLVPRLVEYQVYGLWLGSAQAYWGAAWHEFAYDWRRDNEETVAQFAAKAESLARNAGRRIDVVAHSMGGLVVLAYLLAGGDRTIERAVFVGVPFLGGISFLPDLHLGATTGLNRKLLSTEALFSFPAVYTLFPGGTTSLADASGAPVPVRFFVADDWVREGLGLFADPAARTEANRAFLTRALDGAARFRARLTPPPGTPLPDTKLMVITGIRHATLAQAVKNGPRAVRGWDFESAPAQDGDGRVPVAASVPPPPFAFEHGFSTAEHGAMLNDPFVHLAIFEFLDRP